MLFLKDPKCHSGPLAERSLEKFGDKLGPTLSYRNPPCVYFPGSLTCNRPTQQLVEQPH